jgi:hypothetical protein
MSENTKRILDLLAAGKISVDEATRLISALGEGSGARVDEKTAAARLTPRFLRVTVNPAPTYRKDAPEKVNIRVPVSLIRAGMKFTSLIPEDASREVDKALAEKGIKFNLKNIKEEDLEELMAALTDLEVDIDDGKGKVQIHAEY